MITVEILLLLQDFHISYNLQCSQMRPSMMTLVNDLMSSRFVLRIPSSRECVDQPVSRFEADWRWPLGRTR